MACNSSVCSLFQDWDWGCDVQHHERTRRGFSWRMEGEVRSTRSSAFEVPGTDECDSRPNNRKGSRFHHLTIKQSFSIYLITSVWKSFFFLFNLMRNNINTTQPCLTKPTSNYRAAMWLFYICSVLPQWSTASFIHSHFNWSIWNVIIY